MASTPKMTKAKISIATRTTTALLWSSGQVGQDTLCISSLYESWIYALIFCMLNYIILSTVSARVERLELPANGFGDRYSTN